MRAIKGWKGVDRDLGHLYGGQELQVKFSSFQKLSRICRGNSSAERTSLTNTTARLPWQMVATDLLELKGDHYLLAVDYFSRYPEVYKLSSTTSNAIIAVLKSIFAHHRIPEILRSDNGPQYASKEFSKFAKSYQFNHLTSSSRFPQSNGQVEIMVQTIKRLLKHSVDLHLAVLSYRATPMPWCRLSPSDLCMGRMIRTTIPPVTKQLIPSW